MQAQHTNFLTEVINSVVTYLRDSKKGYIHHQVLDIHETIIKLEKKQENT